MKALAIIITVLLLITLLAALLLIIAYVFLFFSKSFRDADASSIVRRILRGF